MSEDDAVLGVQSEAICGYLTDRVRNNLGVVIGGSTAALLLISAIIVLILAKVKRWYLITFLKFFKSLKFIFDFRCCFKGHVIGRPPPEPPVNNYQKFSKPQVDEDPVYEEIQMAPAVHPTPRPPAVIPRLPLIGLI